MWGVAKANQLHLQEKAVKRPKSQLKIDFIYFWLCKKLQNHDFVHVFCKSKINKIYFQSGNQTITGRPKDLLTSWFFFGKKGSGSWWGLIFRFLPDRTRANEIMSPNRSGSQMPSNVRRRSWKYSWPLPRTFLERSCSFPVPLVPQSFPCHFSTFPRPTKRLSDAARSCYWRKRQSVTTSVPIAETCSEKYRWAQDTNEKTS